MASPPPTRHPQSDDRDGPHPPEISPPTRSSWSRDVRPLDRLSSIKVKLGVLIAVSVTVAAFLTWLGLQVKLGPLFTFPFVIGMALIVTQILARGMTSPLREMTAAAERMAKGDYSTRVHATSRDEVGRLATSFNQMSEDLESSELMRRDLIANVSHELRTPIAALHAQLENIVDGVAQPDAATLRIALAQTERLTRLVKYFLELSRVEAGAVPLTISHINLHDFVAEAFESAQLVATNLSRSVRWKSDIEADLHVYADVERLHQVLANVLTNAIRYSPPDGHITVHAYSDGLWVVIDVADEGPGIPNADRDMVFRRFERGSRQKRTSTSPSTGGTGLGLAIVQWIMVLHGGTIEVADSKKGALMRIRLPVEPNEPNEQGSND